MVHSVFLYPVGGGFDVGRIVTYLARRPDCLLDPLGTGVFLVCGNPQALRVNRERRLADPSRFPYAVLVTLKQDGINVYQEYGDEQRLRNARDIVGWIIARQPCRIEDEYGKDWSDRVAREGVDVLYPLLDG